MATNIYDPFSFYSFVLVSRGWPKSAAVVATAVAWAATGIDLDWSGYGTATAFGFHDQVLRDSGYPTDGGYSEGQTSNIAKDITATGANWQFNDVAWRDPADVGKHVLTRPQKGSAAAALVKEVRKAVQGGGHVGVGGQGVQSANAGWATFQRFVSDWGRSSYGAIGHANAAIRRIRS